MSEFAEHYWGHFAACLRWEQAEAVAERAAGTGPWQAVRPEQSPVAVEDLSGEQAAQRLREDLAEMRRLKRGDYCNLVFVDDPDDPGLIKAFHPRRAGDACRVGGEPIQPWLVLSRYPVDTGVFETGAGPEEEQSSWLSRLFQRHERL